MNYFRRVCQSLIVFILVCTVALGSGCGSVINQSSQPSPLSASHQAEYTQLERGNSPAGQIFGDWVVETSRGLLQDAFVRDDNKLGAVISTQVRPDEVKDLARSLTQGFHKNFPDRDLSVLMYAPDKKLILTARYDHVANEVDYQVAS